MINTPICPTCGCSLVRLGITRESAAVQSYLGTEYYFCCQACVDVFAADPEERFRETKDLIVCPTCLAEKVPESAVTLEHAGQEISFCRCGYCIEAFQKDPEYYLRRLEGAEAAPDPGTTGPEGSEKIKLAALALDKDVAKPSCCAV